METTYAAGGGVLIGTGPAWVLLTDPGDEHVVQALWEALEGAVAARTTAVAPVLALAEAAFGGEPPALAMVDLGGPVPSEASRGAGRVRAEGATRVLTLDDAPRPSTGLRRLVGGVVAASRAELRPPAVPATPEGLIDGIPAEILAAKGPDGPPPPRPRVEERGHTTVRAPLEEVDEVDGSTVHRPVHLAAATEPTVLAVSCPDGHHTPPASPWCRTCRQRIAPQEPRTVPRPILGGLRLPTGEVVPLDRDVVLGRRPEPLPGSADWPHLVHLPADHAFVSRLHLHVALDGWDVVARDLESRGGTVLSAPGRAPERMRGGEPYVLEPGTVLDLAEGYAVRFETGPGASA